MQISRGGAKPVSGLLRPILRQAVDAISRVAAVPGPRQGAEEPPCVLVVDDDPVNRVLACAQLASCGIRTLEACDGAQAVNVARHQKLDLILMDLQMPVLDGYAATRQIRRAEREWLNARVPVVAYTSCDASEVVLGSSGIDGLLKKPCDLQAMQSCVARWCRMPGSSAR